MVLVMLRDASQDSRPSYFDKDAYNNARRVTELLDTDAAADEVLATKILSRSSTRMASTSARAWPTFTMMTFSASTCSSRVGPLTCAGSTAHSTRDTGMRSSEATSSSAWSEITLRPAMVARSKARRDCYRATS